MNSWEPTSRIDGGHLYRMVKYYGSSGKDLKS